MLEIKFDLTRALVEEKLSFFALGDMTLIGNQGEATSRGRTPNQSMMVFISVSDLLYQLRLLLEDARKKEYLFNGIDCSFCVLFKRQKNEIHVFIDKKLIHTSSEIEIAQDVFNSVVAFSKEYRDRLEEESMQYVSDLNSSIDDFKKFLATFK